MNTFVGQRLDCSTMYIKWLSLKIDLQTKLKINLQEWFYKKKKDGNTSMHLYK